MIVINLYREKKKEEEEGKKPHFFCVYFFSFSPTCIFVKFSVVKMQSKKNLLKKLAPKY